MNVIYLKLVQKMTIFMFFMLFKKHFICIKLFSIIKLLKKSFILHMIII
jgi:hypothetical protein